MNDTPEPSPSITLQDIADQLGLAKSTVSLALREKGTLSTATRDRVKQTAKAMGYRPDPLLAALVSRRNRIPADSLPVVFLSGEDSAAAAAYAGVCSRRAHEWGYRLEKRFVRRPGEIKPTLRELWHRGTRGLILYHIPGGDWLESDLLRDLVVVQCRLHREPLPFTTVRSGIVRKTHTTVEKVLAAGYRRIGNVVLLATPDLSHPEDQARVGGVLGAQQRFSDPFRFPPPLMVNLFRHSEDYWREAARKWMVEHRLNAVICTTDGLAEMLFAGWKDRPATACTLLSHVTDGSLAGMCDNTVLLGEKCMELIDQFIRARRFGIPEHPVEVIIPSDWMEGASLPNRYAQR